MTGPFFMGTLSLAHDGVDAATNSANAADNTAIPIDLDFMFFSFRYFYYFYCKTESTVPGADSVYEFSILSPFD